MPRGRPGDAIVSRRSERRRLVARDPSAAPSIVEGRRVRDSPAAVADVEHAEAVTVFAEEMRIGAGLALRGTLDSAGRTRLRVAAEASASPKVRVVLEAAAEEGVDDDRLGEAIAASMPRRR